MNVLKIFILQFIFLSICFGLQSQDFIISGTGYDMHVELNWEDYSGADRYEIWKKGEEDPAYTLLTSTRRLRWIDWTGRTDQHDHFYQYYIEALSVPGAVLATSDTLEAIVSPLEDDQLLDMEQEHTFRYFY
jgi:hypothetical protein